MFLFLFFFLYLHMVVGGEGIQRVFFFFLNNLLLLVKVLNLNKT